MLHGRLERVYVNMTIEITDLLLFILTLAKESFAAIMPEYLKKAIKYGWNALTGSAAWTGYLISALFYLAEEYEFGDTLCELSGYGYDVIDALHTVVSFAEDPAAAAWAGGWEVLRTLYHEFRFKKTNIFHKTK